MKRKERKGSRMEWKGKGRGRREREGDGRELKQKKRKNSEVSKIKQGKISLNKIVRPISIR